MRIKIPKITVQADYEQSSFFGELNLLSIGYGLHLAWVFGCIIAAAQTFNVIPLAQGSYGSTVSVSLAVSSIVYAICLLVYAATDQKLLQVYTSRRVIAAAGALTAAGSVAMVVAGAIGSLLLEGIAGAMTGIGSSMLVLQWGTAFAREESASIALNATFAVVFSILVYSLAVCIIPSPISGIFISVIPVIEAFVLYKKTPVPFTERNEVPVFNPLPVNHVKFFFMLATPVFIFSLALGVLRQAAMHTIIPTASQEQPFMLIAAAGLTAILILATIIALGDSGKWDRYFRPLVPFVAVVAFLLPVLNSQDSMQAQFILLVGYLCFETILWIFFAELAQRFRLSPVLVFGIGRGMVGFGVLLGSLIPVVAQLAIGQIPYGEEAVVVFVLATMVVAYALLPREHEIEAVINPCPLILSASAQHTIGTQRASGTARAKDLPFAQSGFSKTALPLTAPIAETLNPASASAPEPASAPSSETQSSETIANAQPEKPTVSQQDKKQAAKTEAKPSAKKSAMSAENESMQAAATQPKPASAANQEKKRTKSLKASYSKSIFGDDEATGPTATQRLAKASMPLSSKTEKELKALEELQAGKDRPRSGRFRKKCEAIANNYLLSRRETEVMFLLAKGHNSAYIQEKLFISEGTAKTHIRHIYRKTDVHSQQELMRLVESVEVTE